MSKTIAQLTIENNQMLKDLSQRISKIEQLLQNGNISIKSEIKGSDLLLYLNRGKNGGDLKTD
jgi:hypothetical protein